MRIKQPDNQTPKNKTTKQINKHVIKQHNKYTTT